MTALELALAEAREQIRLLQEDRDTQVALAEAAELEHSIVVTQLEEAHRRIAALEQDQAEPSIPGRSDSSHVSVDAGIDFEEEEEEEPDADDLDDVDAIYDRMDDPRVRRQELDRERIDRESEAGDEPYWMVCPKCGDTLEEVETEELKIDRCESCGGLYLDHGEVEMLLLISRGPEGLHRVRSALQI